MYIENGRESALLSQGQLAGKLGRLQMRTQLSFHYYRQVRQVRLLQFSIKKPVDRLSNCRSTALRVLSAIVLEAKSLYHFAQR